MIPHYSKLSVIPKNWEKSNADWKKKWRIYYTFYEQGMPPKQVAIRGMNRAMSLKEKQVITRALLDNEIKQLKAGYNPNKKAIITDDDHQPNKQHTLETALLFALEKKVMDPNTKRVCAEKLNKFLAQAKKMKYHALPIIEIRRRHVIDVLDNFSDNIYNECRARMQMLFKELVKREVIEFNPVDEFIEKRKTTPKLKKLLTKEERQKLYSLQETNYTFWRFINIFYYSARRIREMLAVKKEHVDLENQRFHVLHKKGRKTKWVAVTIQDNALLFWTEIVAEATIDDDYLFAENLRPGKRDKPILYEQIKRRWEVHVQKRFGIKQGFYILKSARLDEIAGEQNIEAAQIAAGHSTKIITMGYAVGEAEREHERKKRQGGKL